MLKRSSIVKGEITPEMIEDAADYVADVMESSRDVGRMVVEGVLERFQWAWARDGGDTSRCIPLQNREPR
jgi:hypothetical protein